MSQPHQIKEEKKKRKKGKSKSIYWNHMQRNLPEYNRHMRINKRKFNLFPEQILMLITFMHMKEDPMETGN